jgi:hypothetical protein
MVLHGRAVCYVLVFIPMMDFLEDNILYPKNMSDNDV